MASLYVAEYASLPVSGLGESKSQCLPTPPLVEQKLAISTSSNASATFSSQTNLVVVTTDQTCSVVFSATNPTASTSNQRIAANEPPRYFIVQPSTQLAVVSNS